MRFFLILLLISTSLSAQLNNDLKAQLKFKSYRYLDSINVYSEDYPTQLIEGSGFIRDGNNKNTGSTGFSIEISKNKNDKIIRILKFESIHYNKSRHKAQKSIINEITVYLDDSQTPDLAKYISKIYISDALVMTKNVLFNLKENNNDRSDFKAVKLLLDEIKKFLP